MGQYADGGAALILREDGEQFLWEVDVQQKLYNDYQAAAFGLSDDDEAETKYKAFLKDRIALKSMVKADCESNNIPESI